MEENRNAKIEEENRNGNEINEEKLTTVNGGKGFHEDYCPNCKRTVTVFCCAGMHTCEVCGHRWPL